MNKKNNILKFFSDSLSWENNDFPAFLKLMLNIVLYILTVAVTIYVTPSINREFEKEKRQTVFYENSLKTLSHDTKDLLGNLTIYVDPTFEKNLRIEARFRIRIQITKLHWQRVEFQLLYADKKNFTTVLQAYSEALEVLSELTGTFDDEQAYKKVPAAVTKFGIASTKLLEYLAHEAGI